MTFLKTFQRHFTGTQLFCANYTKDEGQHTLQTTYPVFTLPLTKTFQTGHDRLSIWSKQVVFTSLPCLCYTA